MSSILLALTALLSWTLSDLIVKKVITKKSLWFLNFWGQLFGGAFILGASFFLNTTKNLSWDAILWILLLGAINTFGMIAFYKAIQRKGIALALPVVSSWAIPSIILTMIFLKEIPTTMQWIGVLIIIAGLFMVTANRKSCFFIDTSFIFAFLSMCTWGVFYFLIREPSRVYGEFLTAGGLKGATALFTIPMLYHSRTVEKSKKMTTLWPILAIGILDGCGLLAITKGLEIGSTAVVTGIISTAPVLVAIAGVLLYKEKITKLQALGIGIAGIGLIVLTIL